MIKVISFDIGGTILVSKSINDYNLKVLTGLTNLPYEDVRKAYKTVFQKQKGTLNELVESFCSMLKIDVTDKILNFFEEKFKDENNISYMDSNIKTILKKLKSLGYKIILFSNSCCLIKNEFDKEILDNIDDTFYSYDYGCTKDEEKIYKLIEKKLKCKSGEILHIGDTLLSDYVMPRKMGWNSVYYGDNENPNICSINKLEEIFDVLGGNLDIWKENEYLEKKRSI